MSTNPTAEVELPPAESNMRDIFLEAEVVGRLLAAAREAGDRDLEWIIALGCECGMRRGEMVACRATWFDLRRGCVTVPPDDAKDQGGGTGAAAAGVWRRKGRAGRRRAATVPLSEVMLELVAHHGLPEPFVIAPKKAWGKSRYRFEFRKRFEAFMAAQGVPEVTIHDLRRSFGSNRVSAGVSIEKVANWMGIDPKTAWARYARFVPADGEINKGAAGAAGKLKAETLKAEILKDEVPRADDDFAGRLGKVEGLFAAGVISAEERAAKRAAILGEI
jgi:integrase